MAKVVKYPVKRGSRYDRLILRPLQDWLKEGMNVLEGLSPDTDAALDEEFTKRSPDYIVGNVEIAAFHMYCRIVAYSGANGTGKRIKIINLDGEEFTIPIPGSTPSDLATGYYQWMKMDERWQTEVDDRIIAANEPLAPRHILPAEQLTEQEKADPNSSGEDVKTKKK